MEQDALFAHVNDSIRKLAEHGLPSQSWDFICECTDVSCHTMVSLTLLEFDEHRTASPPAPILSTVHDG